MLLALGMCRPCQWIERSSWEEVRLLRTWMVRVSPERVSIRGPGNWSGDVNEY